MIRKKWNAPSPEKIEGTRIQARLSRTEAARAACVSRNAWWRYESGVTEIPEGCWELFLLKSARGYLEPSTPFSEVRELGDLA